MKSKGASLILVALFATPSFGQEIEPGLLADPSGNQMFMDAAYNEDLDEFFLTFTGGGKTRALRLAPDPAGIILGTGEQIIISGNGNDTNSVAYNFDDSEYLVVWRRSSGAMYGRYVDGDGTVIGSEFLIRSSAGTHDVAYGNGNYIVVHRKGPAPVKTNYDVIDGDSLSGLRVIKSGTVATGDSSRISFGKVAGTFLVVYQPDFSPGVQKADIRGQMMTAGGFLAGNSFGIATGVENQQIPELGYSDTHDRWLVAFEDWSTGGFPDIRAHYVDSNKSVSSRFNVTNDSAWNTVSAVTYNSSVDKFYVAHGQGAKITDVDPVDKSRGPSVKVNKGSTMTAAASRPHNVKPQVLALSRVGFGKTGVHAHILELPPPPPSFSGSTMPDGFFGKPYNGRVPVQGGTIPLSFQLVSGSLATPLTGPDASGELNGIPNAIGTFGPFRIRVTDADGRFSEANLTHTIKLAPPDLIGPIQATNDTTPTFMWDASPSATSYRIKVKILGGATVLDTSGITDTFFTPNVSGSIAPGLYEWKVSASDGVNTSPFSVPLTLEIDTAAPEAVVLTGRVPMGSTALAGVMVDSVSSAKLPKENLVDGNLLTDWLTNGTTSQKTQFAILDLKGDFNVTAVRLRSDKGNAKRFPRDFHVEISLNKSTWATVQSATVVGATPSTWYEYTFTAAMAHYVRIRVTRENVYSKKYYTRIAEIEVIQESEVLGALEVCFDAPGDDPGVGTAKYFDMRYMQGPATGFNYAGAMEVTNEPGPFAAGVKQCHTIDSLLDETKYSIGLTAIDDAGNISAISNILEMSTKGVPPTSITTLAVSNVGKTTADLSWMSPSDVGSGVMGYDVRYSTDMIDASNFTSAMELDGEPGVLAPNTLQMMPAIDLPSNSTLYLAMTSKDMENNVSGISNVVQIVTLDGKAPGKTTDLNGISGGSSLVNQAPLVASDVSGERTAEGMVKENVVDGNPASKWMSPAAGSPTAPTHITINLGASVNVAQVSLQADNKNAKRFPRGFNIQVSDDPFSGFVTIHSAAGIVAVPSEWFTFDVTPTMAQYVKIEITEMNLYGGAFYAALAQVKVSHLQVLNGGFVLTWTAPANDFDGTTGSADSYDLRYSSTDILTDGDFGLATPVDPAMLPTPQPYGFSETVSLSGFGHENVFYLALKSTDDNNNVSVLSTSTKVATPGTPPDQPVGLSITGATGSSLTLGWTASADDAGDNGSGSVDHYDVRCATTPINNLVDFLAAPSYPGPAPMSPGAPESYTVSPLLNQTMYYCAVRAVDDADNVSMPSATVSGSTLDEIAPAQLSNLSVVFSVSDLPASGDSASSQNRGKAVGNLVDGNLSSDWMSAGVSSVTPQWAVIDLGAIKTIGEVRLRSDDGNAKRFPKDFSIQTRTTTQENWTTVNLQTDVVATPSKWYAYPFADISARYVRVYVTDMNLYSNQYYASFAEIEVYAPGGPQVQASLSWDAAGDDGVVGTADAYDIRFSENAITDLNSFNAATPSSGTYPTPKSPGMSETFEVPDALTAATPYFLGIKTTDDAGKYSITVVSGTTPNVDGSPVDLVAPDPVTNLTVGFSPSVLSLGPDSVSSQRTSVGMVQENVVDGNLSSKWMTEGVSSNQTQWIIVDVGSVQSLTQVRLRSDSGNAKRFPKDFLVEISVDKNIWTTVGNETNFVATPSTWYPFAFTSTPARYIRVWVAEMNEYANKYYASLAEIDAASTGTTFQATLNWNATGDDASVGTALTYDVAYSTSVINDEATFDAAAAAMPVLGEPTPALSGTPQNFNVPAALPGSTLHYIGIKTSDEVGNFSLTFVSGTTPTP